MTAQAIRRGPPGPVGPIGPPGALDPVVYEQAVASVEWIIPHMLGRRGVLVVIEDTSGQRVLTRIEEDDDDPENIVRSISRAPFSGRAYVA